MTDRIIGEVVKWGIAALAGAASVAVGIAVGMMVVKIYETVKQKITSTNIWSVVRSAMRKRNEDKIKKAMAGAIRGVVESRNGNVLKVSMLSDDKKLAELFISAEEISEDVRTGMKHTYSPTEW